MRNFLGKKAILLNSDSMYLLNNYLKTIIDYKNHNYTINVIIVLVVNIIVVSHLLKFKNSCEFRKVADNGKYQHAILFYNVHVT